MIILSEEEKNLFTHLANSHEGQVLAELLKKFQSFLYDQRTYGQLAGDDINDIEKTFRARQQAANIITRFIDFIPLKKIAGKPHSGKDYI